MFSPEHLLPHLLKWLTCKNPICLFLKWLTCKNLEEAICLSTRQFLFKSHLRLLLHCLLLSTLLKTTPWSSWKIGDEEQVRRRKEAQVVQRSEDIGVRAATLVLLGKNVAGQRAGGGRSCQAMVLALIWRRNLKNLLRSLSLTKRRWISSKRWLMNQRRNL